MLRFNKLQLNCSHSDNVEFKAVIMYNILNMLDMFEYSLINYKFYINSLILYKVVYNNNTIKHY